MFKGRSRRRVSRGDGPIEKVPLKGLFSDGIWRCNCDPRLPAQRFQTKNGGHNHGRWFYTCQKPQPSQCKFFLWDDDARIRETAAVLNNTRTEPHYAAPHTPTGSYMTPETTVERSGPSSRNPETTRTPYTPTKGSGAAPRSFAPSPGSPTRGAAALEDDDDEEFFECTLSDDEELSKTSAHVSNRAMPPPETPRKAAKTDMFSTPGKRSYDEMTRDRATAAIHSTVSSPATLLQGDDVFTSASTTNTPNLFTKAHHAPPSPADTPTHLRFHDPSPDGGSSSNNQDSDLTNEILNCLTSHQVSAMTAELQDGIRAIGNRHSLHTRGVTRGRDISRAAIAKKDETIARLQGDIASLQAEREMNIAVLGLMRRELDSAKEKGGK